MAIDIRKPGVQLLLRKNVGRSTASGSTPVSSSYASQSSVVDLTPYLTERSSIRVRKSIREMTGTFAITLGDKVDTDTLDSIYSSIEPMDTIEIRISRVGYVTSGANYPILMRGFVSQVQVMEGMAADGRPTRQVMLNGHDYGKILEILQIFLMPNAPADASAMITSFPFFTKFGLFANVQSAADFTQAVFDSVVNPYLQTMQKGSPSSAAVMAISTDIKITGAQVSPFGIGTFNGGTVADLIKSYSDIGPWNEFFIEDRESGPYAVYRPNPFIDPVSHDLIMSEATMPTVIDIDRRDVVSMTLARTDANVANYYWVDCPRFLLNYGSLSKALAYEQANMYVTNYGNVNPNLYGVRRMTDTSQQANITETDNGNGTPVGTDRTTNRSAALDWINTRREQLYDQNKDNVVLESGSARLKGNETIRAGTYLRYSHGNMKSYLYVTEATYDLIPFGNFFTEVTIERGTGFIDRITAAAGSQAPYYADNAWSNT